ncbi:MAG: sugar ABC transporter ATP-binding protein [Synergistaceae bacterium]|jgi:ABC-type sugar transport system ATPase subunit|nr:sugar ABC transporter ATP-binding protein [Synergistaceae bacterium]
MAGEYIIEMRNICKRFPGVTALDNVDFRIGKGEIHVLMGENGAGKSTLIKILPGIYKKDSGEISFDGRVFEPDGAESVQRAGISTIYQEISLIPQLSVAENIFIGREIKKKGVIDWKTTRMKSSELLRGLGIDIDVERPLGSYGAAVQQMVAVARAISIEARLVVMDEPTSSLDDDEVKILFGIIRKLKSSGISILFISHRLNEVFEISDKITVLKDGQLVGEYETAALSKEELVSKMVGGDARSIIAERRADSGRSHEEFVKAENIKSGRRIRGLDISIGRGEVVGMAGLLGSGRTEFARILFGVDKYDYGHITVNGRQVKFKMPKDGIRAGFAFCSEDRKTDGIIPHMSVKDNISIASLRQVSRFGVLFKSRQADIADQYISKLKIKTPDREHSIMNLSGGNQQKAILARWLCMKPRLVIMDEPTRGIDVGAKREIEDLIRQMAGEGISVLLISSEFDELIRNCDRIEVIRDGTNMKTLTGDEINENNIIRAIAGSGAAENEA